MGAKLQRIQQIGIVTRDLKAMVNRYETLYGVTGWTITGDENGFDPSMKAHDLRVHGKPQDYEIMLAQAMVGDVQIELIQPLDELSDYAMFLKEHGEGVHHICVEMTGLESFHKDMRERGVPELLRGTIPGANTFTYYGTIPEIGMTVEVLGDA